VYFYFTIHPGQDYTFLIETDLLNTKNQYGYDLLKNLVQIINKKKITININSVKYIISLRDCGEDNIPFFMDNYELRPFNNKTMKPKFDKPSLSSTSLLKNFVKENISFVSKYDLNIMLNEQFEENEKNLYLNNSNFDNTNYSYEKDKKKVEKDKKRKTKCLNFCLII